MSPNSQIYRLKNLGLPAMKSLEEFANETRLSTGLIRYLSIRAKYLYKVYEIPKTNGSYRRIAQPSRELKAVQAWILRNILDKLSPSEHCKGFEKGSSILDNASPHVGANYVLTVDLKDFFPSVNASKIFGVFSSIGYNKQMCVLLTNLCTFEGGLPQGAPTSPKLANLTCARLDARIHGYAGSRGIVYTRYADDLTLSAQNLEKILKAKYLINEIVSSEELTINNAKTRLSGTKRQKKITGLIVSANNVGIGREKFREIRANLHHLYIKKNTDFPHVNGLLAFTYSVDRKSYKKLYSYIDKLDKKYSPNEITTKLHKEKKIIYK